MKQLKLYLDNGYLNFPEIYNQETFINLIVGGRATGKTYGALKYVIENNIKFIYMRRTQTQVDMISTIDFSPFKKLNDDMGWDIIPDTVTKGISGFYHSFTNEAGKVKPTGEPLGYLLALSTISNLRGFDASDVEVIIYDEFIKERHEKPLKSEGRALLNAYETINRNREFAGHEPLKLFCLANADDLGNDVFMELMLVERAEWMVRNNREYWLDFGLGIGLYILRKSPISDRKKETALYKMIGNSDFSRMSTDNKFAEESIKEISGQPLEEYKPIAAYGEICIYKHKSNRSYYISLHRSGTVDRYENTEIDRKRFVRKYVYLWEAYMRQDVKFESYLVLRMFENAFKM